MSRRFADTRLVIATHNTGKLDEFRQLFAAAGLDIALDCALDHNLDAPAETGMTFAENATIKALYVAQKTGLPALADDSGLCVTALDGAPGIYSADWMAQPDGTRNATAAMEKLHALLGPATDRRAGFVACLVLAWPDGHTEQVQGQVDGHIIWPPRGTGGHGYDPCFVRDGDTLTYAELSPADKNSHSHRARAFQALLEKCFAE